MTFSPIAIVGRGCVLPGALDPASLWTRILRRDDLTGPATRRMWGLEPSAVCVDPLEPSASARGGYVTGFAPTWTPDGVLLTPEQAAALPEGWRWLIDAGRQALDESGIGTDGGARVGLVVGNLGYATRELAETAARRWTGDVDADSPALEGQSGALYWTARALGLAGPRLSLDAACASGLYALHLACEALQRGRADAMLAAGLNCADDLFLHVGFTALSALSRSGRSMPLSALADGLLPAHGAAVLVLKRLDDAVAAGDQVLGIVRGVGLSNDGRGPGLLAPASSGQQRAIRAAYAASGLRPGDVGYLECHATGTAVGDREEILSVRAVFGEAHALPLGSLKAQLGHLITASGTAGLVKLCGVFEHDMLPPAPQVSLDHPAEVLLDCALQLPGGAVKWAPARAPRLAAINAFGFGGCNAHAVLAGPEAADDLVRKPRRRSRASDVASVAAPAPVPLAVVGCEVAVGAATDTSAVLRVLLELDAPTRRIGDVDLAVQGLGFPPADLRHALPQQLLLLRAAEALRPQLEGLDRARVGVYVGTDVDPAGARHGCRWRLDQLLGRRATREERGGIAPPLVAAGVLGTMPNMPANRLNSMLDAGGPGFVVNDGAVSGTRALQVAADAIGRGEIDAALVGAVDASGGAFGDDPSRSDAAVVLLVVRDALATSRDVIARLTPADDAADIVPTLPWADAGSAQALLQLAVGALCCRHALQLDRPALPWVAAERLVRAHGWEVRAAQVQGLAEEVPDLAPAADGVPVPEGDLTWVFTGAAAAYPGAGLPLLRAFPIIADDLRAMAPRLAGTLPALAGAPALSLIEQLQLATLVSQAQAKLLRRLGLSPAAVIGLSSGETNSLLATGTWTDADALFDDVARSGMYDRYLAGDYQTLREAWALSSTEPVSWRCYRVLHHVDALRAAIAARTRVRLLIVHHAGDAVIGGEDRECQALIAALGAQAVPIEHDLLVHCPELDPFAATWYRVHHRATTPDAALRVYANAAHGHYAPSADACATMITTQARETVEFDRTVRQAWDDGARTFVEFGPRQACTGWIRTILAGRPHTACALDGARGSLVDLTAALSAIAAAGHPVDRDAWQALTGRVRALPAAVPSPAPRRGCVRLAGHRPLPTFHDPRPRVLVLATPPALAPTLPDRLRPVVTSATDAESRLASTALTAASDHDMPESASAPAALLALAQTQQALLDSQALAVEHLVGQTGITAEGLGWESTHGPVGGPVAAPVAPRVAAPGAPAAVAVGPSGPTFTREQLAIHAGGRISEIFGATFAVQDDYRRQVRMPMEPLLLADRVTGMTGQAASMKTGRVWTETDIRPDSWYLHQGRMPAGILIESGQADLFLVSWLGIDLLNRGDRVYRLLGCELTFHGRLPRIGETLRYDIAIDGHARHGDIGLFFFHYDCHAGDRPQLTVKQGQAGFFTDAELAGSAGVLWDPTEDLPPADAPVAGPRPGVTPKPRYSDDEVRAFAAGDALSAFGAAGFLRTGSHTRTPRIPAGRMQLFDRVDEFDASGGPWGRGYMKATLDITPDQWFFPGHFKNDPCMPGTLMFEGCLQTMAFYMAALGFTVDRDGWDFEPEAERPYQLRCRGQVTPASTTVTYEVFVAEVHNGVEPMLVADLMCTVDGLRAFHCRRMALRLRPDFPLSAYDLSLVAPDREPVAEIDGFRYGQASLLACATGHPTAAFGPLYASLPESRRVPRLPAPPYHFISRVTSLSDRPGQMKAGAVVETAYDLPADAWYFAAHPTGQMPVCVLIEVALQPCGWLASYVGCAVREADEVYFRNLDGKGVLHRAVRPEDGCVRVRSTLKGISKAGGMTIVTFDVRCRVDSGDTIYELATAFGFFPKAALEGQAGLPAEPADVALAVATSDVDLLTTLSDAARALLPRPPLTMCERVTHRRVDADGRAVLRGEKRVEPSEWFLRAHFFQDPVQPGSLGVEALVQLLQAHLLLEGAAEALPTGEFADLVASETNIWQFRGQVLPEATMAAFTLTAQPIRKDGDRWTVTAEGSLWADGRRIYHVRALTVSFAATPGGRPRRLRLDPAAQPWWGDHRPTYTVPVLPGMAMLSAAVDVEADVVGVDQFTLRRWLVLDRARDLAVSVDGDHIRLVEDGSTLAEGTLVRSGPGNHAPAAITPLPKTAAALPDPYASGAMFHGPAYHRVLEGRRTAAGTDLSLRIDPAMDARERVPHILLDAGLHGVPHDALETWFPELPAGQIGYPAIVERFRLFAPAPRDGRCEVRVRPDGYHDAARRFPRLKAHFLAGGTLWAELVLVEACFPATRLGQLAGSDRRAFLRDGRFVAGARLSDESSGVSTLTSSAVSAADWLPGTVQAIYGLPSGLLPAARLATIAGREHAATRLQVHPRAIEVAADGRVRSRALPLLDYQVGVDGDARQTVVEDRSGPALDVAAVRAWWLGRGWQSDQPELQALFFAACRRFVRYVRLTAPEAIARVHGAPLLLLANHQVAVESLIAGMTLPPVLGRPLVTLAKREHRDTWVGRLALGLNDPTQGPPIVYVDRDRQQDMLERLTEMSAIVRAGQRSIMIHVEGTRAVAGGQPVTTVSGIWADLAVKAGLTIVPLRFCGGLPHAAVDARLEFPLGLGAQDLVLGRPIAPDTLAGLHLNGRRDRILDGLAELDAYDREPAGDAAFAARVHAARTRWDLDELRAVFLLLEAEAAGWVLDAEGLPTEAVARRDGGEAFWAWFAGAEKPQAR